MKITKEQYEEIINSSDEAKKALELGLIHESDYYGYGIRSFHVYEENGEYFLTYSTWDNCD